MIVRNGFEVLLERVQALKVFQRNKKFLRLKFLSTLLYYAGLSYRLLLGSPAWRHLSAMKQLGFG
jgi:hypothetical protein